VINIRQKDDLPFALKDYEERSVPLFPELAELLKKRRKRHPKSYLVFPTTAQIGRAGGKADGHMLEKLKRLAYRAGLNCGRCAGKFEGRSASCESAPICRLFGLHKFRSTYPSTALRDGMDLPTVQRLLGHSEIETTRVYLREWRAQNCRPGCGRRHSRSDYSAR